MDGEVLDVGHLRAGSARGLQDRGGKLVGGHPPHRLPVHLQVVLTGRHRGAGGRHAGPARTDLHVRRGLGIGVPGHDPVPGLGPPEDHRARGIAQERAQGPVGRADRAGSGVRADDENVSEVLVLEQVCRGEDPVDRAGATDLREVQREGRPGADGVHHRQGRSGKRLVGSEGGDDHGVDRTGRDSAAFQGLVRRRDRHVGGDLALRQVPAFLDPGARGDPLVGGVERTYEFGVAHHSFGQVEPGTHDAHRVGQARALPGPGRLEQCRTAVRGVCGAGRGDVHGHFPSCVSCSPRTAVILNSAHVTNEAPLLAIRTWSPGPTCPVRSRWSSEST
ncbi:hypothetical protein SUDANB57_06634 (plasmid) [Streptomyces sp. enrichment culture]